MVLYLCAPYTYQYFPQLVQNDLWWNLIQVQYVKPKMLLLNFFTVRFWQTQPVLTVNLTDFYRHTTSRFLCVCEREIRIRWGWSLTHKPADSEVTGHSPDALQTDSMLGKHEHLHHPSETKHKHQSDLRFIHTHRYCRVCSVHFNCYLNVENIFCFSTRSSTLV